LQHDQRIDDGRAARGHERRRRAYGDDRAARAVS
jgi:hypothetical protein